MEVLNIEEMQERFIIKTHTKALRPGNYSILITKCTFPDMSNYPEHVTKLLTKFLDNESNNIKDEKIGSVAKYTVLTATSKNRGFGFLSETMIWSWKGHVINTVLRYLNKESEDKNVYFKLEKLERITYLKYYLETEGAFILKLAERFIDREEISYSYLKDEIHNIFRKIYEGYIDIAPDFRSRIKIKEDFEMFKRQLKDKQYGYKKGTLPHKIKPHIQAFSDLGILSVDKKNDEEIYRSSVFNGVSSFNVFYRELIDFKKMEEVFSNDDYFPLIAKALNLNPLIYSPELHKDSLRQTFLYGYKVMRDKVTGMADIDALVDWSCAKLLSEENILITREDIEEFLNEMRKVNPSSIRYHVDGKGRISYLILEL